MLRWRRQCREFIPLNSVDNDVWILSLIFVFLAADDGGIKVFINVLNKFFCMFLCKYGRYQTRNAKWRHVNKDRNDINKWQKLQLYCLCEEMEMEIIWKSILIIWVVNWAKMIFSSRPELTPNYFFLNIYETRIDS